MTGRQTVDDGPPYFFHVRCPLCKTSYNSQSDKSQEDAIDKAQARLEDHAPICPKRVK